MSSRALLEFEQTQRRIGKRDKARGTPGIALTSLASRRSRSFSDLSDLEQYVLPGHAGEALAHFFGTDRVPGFSQELGFHVRRYDFGIDQNAVTVEDDEIEAIAHKNILPLKGLWIWHALIQKPLRTFWGLL
jgi:hypothetical protein